MLRLIAMGVPFPLGDPSSATSGWDFWPVAGFIGCLMLLRYVVEVRLHWPLVLACLILGTILASVVDAWGIPAGLGMAMAGAMLARLLRPTLHFR
jgi:hypothetical protein